MRRFKPYLPYIRSEIRLLVLALLCGLVYAATTGMLPLVVNVVFPPIFEQGAMPKDLSPSDLIHKFLHEKAPAAEKSLAPAQAAPPTVQPVPRPSQAPEAPGRLALASILEIAACIPIVFLMRAVCGYLNGFLTMKAGVRILEQIRTDYFRKLQVLPLSFIQASGTGDLVSRGMSDAGQLQTTLTAFATDGIKAPFQLIFALGVLVWLGWTNNGVWLMLGCLSIVPLSIFPIRYVGKKVIHRSHQQYSHLGSLTSHFTENLSAAREVRAFGLEEREVSRFADWSTKLFNAQVKIAKYDQALSPSLEFIATTGIAVSFAAAYAAHIHFATFIAIIAALYLCYDPLKRMGGFNNVMNRGLAALDRIEEVLNEPMTIKDPERPVPVGRLRGEIAFKDVVFSYRTGGPVFRGLSTHIPAGTVCALVGPSGGGKTTFINLIPRFYETVSGQVTVDGIDLRDMRLADLRGNIALVSQEPVLFNDTIFNNLLLGRPGASREAVIEAARNANADDFIRKLPNGYDTIVGERGGLVSGGQRQRLALARAFLRNAPILILDEATNALDADSEAAVQDALRRLMVGKTVIIIAHRFSTIRDASLILVFERGSIVARGTHAELYAGSPLYHSLYDRQTAGVES